MTSTVLVYSTKALLAWKEYIGEVLVARKDKRTLGIRKPTDGYDFGDSDDLVLGMVVGLSSKMNGMLWGFGG